MNAEIIAVGTEITSGQNLDTNSRWLSQRLAELGIRVAFHTSVSDTLEENIAVLETALQRVDLIVISGGLGPTLDDLTREALAKTLDLPLIEDAASLQHIVELFQRRGRTMPERNRVQALIPDGAVPLPNPVGTAPGIWLQYRNKWIVALPGVPSELYPMFQDHVRPRLESMVHEGQVIIERKINTFGAGESLVEERLGDITRRGRVPEVGITVSDATISLRILAKAKSRHEAEALIAPTETEIRARLGNLVFGTDHEELEDVVVHHLIRQGQVVACAESITGGLVAHRLSRVAGASQVLLGGVVAYTDAVKIQHLNVSPQLIAKHSAVSEPVAKAMATGIRQKFQADFGLATTGYAGPGPGPDGTPAGQTYIAVATSDGVEVQSLTWVGTRHEVQSRTAKAVINLLRLQLIGK